MFATASWQVVACVLEFSLAQVVQQVSGGVVSNIVMAFLVAVSVSARAPQSATTILGGLFGGFSASCCVVSFNGCRSSLSSAYSRATAEDASDVGLIGAIAL